MREMHLPVYLTGYLDERKLRVCWRFKTLNAYIYITIQWHPGPELGTKRSGTKLEPRKTCDIGKIGKPKASSKRPWQLDKTVYWDFFSFNAEDSPTGIYYCRLYQIEMNSAGNRATAATKFFEKKASIIMKAGRGKRGISKVSPSILSSDEGMLFLSFVARILNKLKTMKRLTDDASRLGSQPWLARDSSWIPTSLGTNFQTLYHKTMHWDPHCHWNAIFSELLCPIHGWIWRPQSVYLTRTSLATSRNSWMSIAVRFRPKLIGQRRILRTRHSHRDLSSYWRTRRVWWRRTSMRNSSCRTEYYGTNKFSARLLDSKIPCTRDLTRGCWSCGSSLYFLAQIPLQTQFHWVLLSVGCVWGCGQEISSG